MASFSEPLDAVKARQGQGDEIAFIDESVRTSPDGGMYLVTAAVVRRQDRLAVERGLRTAMGRRRRRAHWHDESEQSRFRLIDHLAGLPVRGVTVTVAPMVPRRQEKAREVALWNLVTHLEPMNVTELILDTRQDRLNGRDRRTFWAMRRSGLGEGIRYEFGRPSEDVGLWAADALAGAIGTSLMQGDDRYIKTLPDEMLAVHRVAA